MSTIHRYSHIRTCCVQLTNQPRCGTGKRVKLNMKVFITMDSPSYAQAGHLDGEDKYQALIHEDLFSIQLPQKPLKQNQHLLDD